MRPASLRVALFGGVRVEHDAHDGPVSLTPSVQALLAYLLLHRGRPTPRDTLAGIFWGDVLERRARRCLNTTLWRLRRVLEPDGVPSGTYVLCTPGRQIAFNDGSDFWLDVAEFEEAVRVTRSPADLVEDRTIDRLDRALQSYQADLLDGIYDEWALTERDRLRKLYLDSLAWLMRYREQTHAPGRAIDCGLRILERDPLRETVHRDLMRIYLDCGRRAAAVRQYEACRTVLEEELGIPPSDETMALYRRSRPPRFAAPEEPGAGEDIVRAALEELEQMLPAFDEARERLNRLILLIRDANGQEPRRSRPRWANREGIRSSTDSASVSRET